MSCCSPRYAEAERQFGPAIASRDLDRYHRKGPDGPARLLLRVLSDQVRKGDSILDIGAGVGVLDFELLANGVSTATLVDASSAYVEAAGREAAARNLTDRVRCVAGEFTGLADSVASADIVTMHRVVCCYPDHASLLRAATSHARRVLAFSYPRDRWYIRTWLGIENGLRRLSGKGFRTFVHSPAAMNAAIMKAGFRRVRQSRTCVWVIDVYVRQ